jgi:hypothetical protein
VAVALGAVEVAGASAEATGTVGSPTGMGLRKTVGGALVVVGCAAEAEAHAAVRITLSSVIPRRQARGSEHERDEAPDFIT